jgi:hypothetical protein
MAFLQLHINDTLGEPRAVAVPLHPKSCVRSTFDLDGRLVPCRIDPLANSGRREAGLVNADVNAPNSIRLVAISNTIALSQSTNSTSRSEASHSIAVLFLSWMASGATMTAVSAIPACSNASSTD